MADEMRSVMKWADWGQKYTINAVWAILSVVSSALSDVFASVAVAAGPGAARAPAGAGPAELVRLVRVGAALARCHAGLVSRVQVLAGVRARQALCVRSAFFAAVGARLTSTAVILVCAAGAIAHALSAVLERKVFLTRGASVCIAFRALERAWHAHTVPAKGAGDLVAVILAARALQEGALVAREALVF